MSEQGMTGRWQIVAWEQVYDDGRRTYPMGQQLEGFIQYDPDGRMMCMLCRGDRRNFTSGGQWNASEQEKAQAYNTMLAYAGTYTCSGDIVSHHVELSAFPNWKGGTQKRRIETMDAGQLVLVARLEDGTSEARTARLAWKRS
ncbi:MAG TPA: lipocalin-like domain-containing protein [Noviherbaspirillum sp.]|uniref:lipocalin-like domain-containing protein n=1 Tax=Noviherbaspirillum sp. TaxID=1926288 RepID=UPI002B4A30E5|nr:lipocalin-like domain-containing protein [Noviherbaspirillum sp.]HJV86884.1 lipocalin-like domain-containing protein [Noviherbaspirillum sp.]